MATSRSSNLARGLLGERSDPYYKKLDLDDPHEAREVEIGRDMVALSERIDEPEQKSELLALAHELLRMHEVEQ